MPKAAGTQPLLRFRTAPARQPLGMRGLLTTTRVTSRPSIDELGDLSITLGPWDKRAVLYSAQILSKDEKNARGSSLQATW